MQEHRINKRRTSIHPSIHPSIHQGLREVAFTNYKFATKLLSAMASRALWFRYLLSKINYSLDHAYGHGKSIMDTKNLDTLFRTIFMQKLTFLHWPKGDEMAAAIGSRGATLLVRKIANPDTENVNVRDVVVLKDPENSSRYIVRRVAAVEGYEMASTDEKDEPFVLEENQCWVLTDAEESTPKESYDSRTFGPVNMTDIVGRVIYYLTSAADHGPVSNSRSSEQEDTPILTMELDVDEMAKNHKA